MIVKRIMAMRIIVKIIKKIDTLIDIVDQTHSAITLNILIINRQKQFPICSAEKVSKLRSYSMTYNIASIGPTVL